ncbi:unnamed protein product [Adineta steineri]|uniref:Uncharacterized protein n=1 Tax=Adineta steineri TaxID=433720 RepID=A0A820JE77_9BILA|nr:unnamed protein product [Adineta steineri]
MRFIVLNGHALYSAWLLVAGSLNLAISLKTKLSLSNEGLATTLSLIVLTIGIIIYWILENFVFPSQMAYTWSPWLVWFIALAGILGKNWKLLREKSLNQLLVYTKQEIPTGSHPAGL